MTRLLNKRGLRHLVTVALGLELAALGSQVWLTGCGGHSTAPAQPGSGGGRSFEAGAAGKDYGAGAVSSGAASSGAVGVAGGATAGAGGAVASAGASGSGSSGRASAAGMGAVSGDTAGGGGATTCSSSPTAPLLASDIVEFNDNGAWNWFQDERALVDTAGNKFVIGSVASGGTRDGYVEAVVYDIATGTKKLFTLGTALASWVDEHNAPAFLRRSDGKYLAMWAGHRIDCESRTSIFDGSAWSAEKSFDWTALGCPWAGASTNMITYANPWAIGDSILSAVRSVGTDPAFLASNDGGATWNYYGRLMSIGSVDHVGGYFKYWGNNRDRVDFVGTEGHPRDVDSSLYHGYIAGGMVYDSAGVVKDAMLQDLSATTSTSVDVTNYTPVFETGTTLNGVKLEHAWNHDIVRYADGSIAVLGQARVNGSGSEDPDLRLIYARFDGTSWKTTYLGKAGHKLYWDEQDFTGVSALHPDNPSVIFVSTTVDPRDDTTVLAKHELFEGVTCDSGATWRWAPLTENSTVDNLRPIVPQWDSSHTLLLWLRGTYTSAQSYKLAVVGTTRLAPLSCDCRPD